VSLTWAGGGASNIAGWCPIPIALLHYINVVIGKFIYLFWYYYINKWIKEWYIKQKKKWVHERNSWSATPEGRLMIGHLTMSMDYIDIRIFNKTWLVAHKERLMMSRGFLDISIFR